MKKRTSVQGSGGDYYENMMIGVDIYKDYKFDRVSDYLELGYTDWKWGWEAIRYLEEGGIVSKESLWPGKSVKVRDLIDKDGKTIKYSMEGAEFTLDELR